MQKKLLAVAVAGALLPAAAIAQTSVTIYGTFSTSLERRSATGGDTQVASTSSVRNSAAAQNLGGGLATAAAPLVADIGSHNATQAAGSNFGIRVREDLGGGMAAWLQFEISTSAIGGYSPASTAAGGAHLTARNSGLGIGSKAWGDFLWGTWDSPFNVNMNPAPQHAPYGNASTSFSSQMFGGNPVTPGTVSSFDARAVCNAGGGTFTGFSATTCLASGMSFHRRVPNSVQYWSPNWGGFQLKVMYADERQLDADNVQTPTGTRPNKIKPNLWGGSLTYSAGPLYVGLGYERHNDYVAVSARTLNPAGLAVGFGGGAATAQTAQISVSSTGISGSKDTAWNLNARYTFGAFTVGAYYERLKWTMSYGTAVGGDITELRKNAWGFEGAFVTGPHTLGVRYAKARNLEGNTTAVAGVGGSWNGEATGATGWIFGYGYSLSKRTSLNLYHVRITNDTNARYAGIVFGGLTPAAGGDPRYTGFGLRHTF